MIEEDRKKTPKITSLNALRAPIKSELSLFRDFFKQAVATKVMFLDTVLNFLLRSKGKELRPMLVFYSSKLFGDSNRSTLIAATMVELLHTATLVHDDVVDEADTRRNFFTINYVWKNKVAVLLGDYLLSRGLLVALDNDEFEMLKILSTAVRRMSEGELRQLKASKLMNITEDKYFEIIGGKTASLLSVCTELGAISAGASVEVREKMRNLGEHLGIAFQIRDDLFDFEDNNTGKSKGNDIVERKVTLPLISALDRSTRVENNAMRKLIKKRNKSDSDVQDVIRFVKKYKGDEYARLRMISEAEKAMSILNELQVNPHAKEHFESLIYFVLNRKK